MAVLKARTVNEKTDAIRAKYIYMYMYIPPDVNEKGILLQLLLGTRGEIHFIIRLFQQDSTTHTTSERHRYTRAFSGAFFNGRGLKIWIEREMYSDIARDCQVLYIPLPSSLQARM